MNPDILAACIAYLRTNPTIVQAFGDASSSIHFWGDYAGTTSPAFPYVLFAEPQDSESYETKDEEGDVWSVLDGVIQCQVFAGSKTAARQLADLVGSALNDAPLDFCSIASAGAGTVAATLGASTLAFADTQEGLAGLYVTVQGDSSVGAIGSTSNGLYLIGSGSGSSWSITPAFRGMTLTAAPWWTASPAGLIYFRRTGRFFPVITDIGPDGRPTAYSRVVSWRYQYEQLDGVLAD